MSTLRTVRFKLRPEETATVALAVSHVQGGTEGFSYTTALVDVADIAGACFKEGREPWESAALSGILYALRKLDISANKVTVKIEAIKARIDRQHSDGIAVAACACVLAALGSLDAETSDLGEWELCGNPPASPASRPSPPSSQQ